MKRGNIIGGIIGIVVGIAMIIVSQTVSFTYKVMRSTDAGILGSISFPSYETNYALKNGILYGGIGLLVICGIILAFGFGGMIKQNMPSQAAKFCSDCVTKLSSDDKFCPNCGEKIE